MTFADQTIGEFLERVASKQVTPSGGAVAAVGGAMGAALCEMACIHTVGSDEDTDGTTELDGTRDELGELRVRLLELADEDAAAVDQVGASFGTEVSAERRRAAARRATEVPLETAEACLDVLEHAVTVTEQGNPNAVPDAVTGAYIARAAIRAVTATVRANSAMLDDEFAAETADRAGATEAAADRAMAQVRANADVPGSEEVSDTADRDE